MIYLRRAVGSGAIRIGVLLALVTLVPACGSSGGGGNLLAGPPPVLTLETAALPPGTNGTAYPSTALVAASGTPPYAFSILSGALPPGLGLAAGTISGTPTLEGVFGFVVRVTDSKNVVADRLLSITVTGGAATALALSSATPLPGATQNAAYSFTLSATGGVQPYAWAVTAGALPAGLSLNPATGTITGTPTAASAGFTVTVSDSTAPVPQTSSKAFTLPLSAALSVTSTLPAATVNAPYSHTPTFSGGTAPFDWWIVSGSLPPGLTLSAAGLISGTPTTSGVYSFVLNLTDAAGDSVSTGMDILVNGALSVTTSSLPANTVNIAYASVTLTASGGTTPYVSWALTAGALPAGITLTSATGVLSGTPTVSGTFSVTFTVTDTAGATASSASLTLQVNVVPSLAAPALPQDTEGIPYSQQLAATGGTPSLTYALATGSLLPTGLTLSPSGLLSGTPAALYNSSFSVVVTDAVGAKTAPVAIALVINGPPVITNLAPSPDDVGHAYPTYTLTLTGGTLPVRSWAVTSGTLPPGLTLTGASIGGTPTTAGSYAFTITVTDAAGATGSQAFTIVINAGPTVKTTTLPGATQGVSYSQTLAVTGGTPTFTWALATGSNPLPAGLALSAAGVLSGIPTGAGTFTFSVQVTDGDSNTSAPQSLSITITGSAPSITTTALPNGTTSSFYSITLQVSGGVAPYTWAQQAGTTLPTGVTLSAGGVLSGTPTSSGSFTLIVKVTDSATPAAQTSAASTLTFTITPASAPQGTLTVLTTRLPDAIAGTAYSNTLDATGGTAPYTFTLDATGNHLPASLSLAAGAVHGTPAVADEGQYTFGVTVTDSTATPLVAHANVKLVVGPAPSALALGTASLPAGQVDTAYPATAMVATGGQPPYSWAFTGGSVVPFGLVLTRGGVLYGYPRQNGLFPVQISVTDASSPPQTLVSAPLTLTIASAASGFQITSTSLPNGTVGSAYAQTLTSNAAASQWVANPAILADAGLSLNATTGVISSATSVTASGVLNVPVAAVSNATSPTGAVANVTITIPPPAFGVTTTLLADFVVGRSYNATLANQGGTGPFIWSVAGGALPPGLSLSAAGALTGTPTGGGSGSPAILFQVKDSTAKTATGIVVLAEAPTGGAFSSTAAAPQSYDTALLPPATLTRGTAAAAFVMGVENTSPDLTQSHLLTGQNLPGGLALDPLRRSISGTPTTPGRYVPVFLLSELSESQTGSGPVPAVSASAGIIEIQEPASGFTVLTHTLPTGREGVVYPKTQILTGGVASGTLTFSLTALSGPLPPGITLDPSGFLSGTPTESGVFPVVVQVVNGATTLTAAYDLAIDPALPFGIAPVGLSVATVGVPYQETIYAYGATGAIAWTDAGSATTFASLGLALGAATGQVTGSPTAAAGLYAIQVTATNAGHTSVRVLGLLIAQTPVTAQYFAFPGVVGFTYGDSIQAFGGTAPYSIALVPGETLPAGITLAASGALSGTPTASAPFGGPLVAITDSTSGTPRTGFGQLLLVVLDPLTPALGLPAGPDGLSGQVGTAFSFTPAPYGGTAPYTLSQETTIPPASADDGLPPGVNLTGGTALSGTPTESGVFTYTLKVTDSSPTPKSIDAQLVLSIQPSATTLGIETTELPMGVSGTAYPATQITMISNGVAGPYTWSLSNLPAALSSLSISAAGSVSSSAALTSGTYFFTVTVKSGAATGSGRVKLVVP